MSLQDDVYRDGRKTCGVGVAWKKRPLDESGEKSFGKTVAECSS